MQQALCMELGSDSSDGGREVELGSDDSSQPRRPSRQAKFCRRGIVVGSGSVELGRDSSSEMEEMGTRSEHIECSRSSEVASGSESDLAGATRSNGATQKKRTRDSSDVCLGSDVSSDPLPVSKKGRRQPRSKAESMGECFAWALQALVVLQDMFGEMVFRRLGTRPWRFTTHFSGLGTVDVALDMLRAAFKVAARAPLEAEVVSSCEASKTLQEVLVQRSDGCVFGDIFERIEGGAEAANAASSESYKCYVANALVAEGAECVKHDRAGCKAFKRATCDISGSSCRPWSRANRKKRGMKHSDTKQFWAWVRIIRQDLPSIVIHENVVCFPDSFLTEGLGDLYDVIPLSVQPADAGFGFMRRNRRYHVLALRGVVALSTLPGLYTHLTDQLAKDVSAWPRWVWRATKEELECELATASSCEQPSSRGGWWPRLTPNQQTYIEGYTDSWQRKHGSPPEESAACVFDLSDTPQYKTGSNAVTLPTLRQRRGRWWSPMHRRWMLPREKAACMGFPVYDDLAVASRTKLDKLTVEHAGFIGNAMHVANVGVVMLAAMFAAEWRERVEPTTECHRGRSSHS